MKARCGNGSPGPDHAAAEGKCIEANAVSDIDNTGYASPRRGFMYTHEDGGKLDPFKLLEWAEQYFGNYAATFRVWAKH